MCALLFYCMGLCYVLLLHVIYIKYQQCSCFAVIPVQVYMRLNVYSWGLHTPRVHVTDHVTYYYIVLWEMGRDIVYLSSYVCLYYVHS